MTTGSVTTAAADLPRGLWVGRRTERLLLARRWYWQMPGAFTMMSVVFGGFALVVGGALVMAARGTLGRTLTPSEWFWLALMGAIGVLGSYYTLGGFVNTTFIDVTRGSLRLWHSPLPWFGCRRIPSASIRQLYTERTVTHGRSDQDYRVTRVERVSYLLRARLKDSRDLILIANLPDPDTAKVIEAEVEAFLGIEDLPVPGVGRV